MAHSGNISSECIDTILDQDLLAQLRELCGMRSVVYFEFGNDPSKTYISRLQGIHDDSAMLVDSLMPPGGDDLLRAASRVNICCTNNGVRYEFEASLVGTVNGAPAAFMLALPSVLTRIQIRQYARVSFSEESAIPVRVIRGANAPESISGVAVQLGAGGMGLIVASPKGWEAGTKIGKLMFALPSGHIIYTAATVRSLFPVYGADGGISGYRCNLQFVKLEQRYSATLEAFVFRKQLEAGSAAM